MLLFRDSNAVTGTPTCITRASVKIFRVDAKM